MNHKVNKSNLFIVGGIMMSLAAHANSGVTWLRKSAMLKYREDSNGPRYEYDYLRFQDTPTSPITGYQKYTSFINPGNSWQNTTPGPVYTEHSIYTVGTPSNFVDYDYESEWGVNVTITSSGGANVSASMDYKTRNADGTLSTTMATHNETKVVGVGTFNLLWARFKANQSDHLTSNSLIIW